MWSLLRIYLLGKLLGGNRGAGQVRRGGCGCFTLLLLLGIAALVLYLLGFMGNQATNTGYGW